MAIRTPIKLMPYKDSDALSVAGDVETRRQARCGLAPPVLARARLAWNLNDQRDQRINNLIHFIRLVQESHNISHHLVS